MQSETVKHTPGPWWVEIGDESSDHAHQWPVVMSSSREVVGTEGLYGDIHEDKANARLIAAAPQLLSIAERLSKLREGLDNSNSAAEYAACNLAAEAQQLLAEINGIAT